MRGAWEPGAERWEGASVTVLGLARSGEAAACALLARGARVTVLDATDGSVQRERATRLGGATAILGRAEPGDVAGAGLVVASPGVPWSSPWIEAAEGEGIPVWSEVELAFRLGARVAVAITGTNGKTTTTEMVAAALGASGRPAVAAGNVGLPLTAALDAPLVVTELSSFQLRGIVAFRAPVAVLLNIANDHLDWHGSFEEYARAKARIFENQGEGDTAIYHDDPMCASALAEGVAATEGMAVGRAARAPEGEESHRLAFSEDELPFGGAGIEDGWIATPWGRVVEVARLRARGRPHRADAVAAAAAACALGADPASVGEALAAFVPKPHRVEHVATIGGVAYVDDSKATSPHATLAALGEMDHVVLIAGGRNKGLDLSELAQAAPRLRAAVAIGEAAGEVERALGSAGVPVTSAASMDEAVDEARARSAAGDTVLLSPACASFDMFDGYEARGKAFQAAVRRIEREGNVDAIVESSARSAAGEVAGGAAGSAPVARASGTGNGVRS